ncbi:MAG: hypothetical protein JNK79_11340 [Chitinophagaceae bacterium]|nr:hypothetical protein [Chitinophagaceae bacterium]
MIKASNPELLVHFAVLESGNNSLANLTNIYSEHLLTCLSKWYGSALYDDPSLAYEAVYQSLRHYSEHPRKYNPEHGGLARFLELNADRAMQEIFEREKYSVRSASIDHQLARLFDNERDFQLAKLILKNENDVPAFVDLLDIGSYRIAEQLSEIKRHTQRIQKILDSNITAEVPKVKKHRAKTRNTAIRA